MKVPCFLEVPAKTKAIDIGGSSPNYQYLAQYLSADEVKEKVGVEV
jgi:hypothetical protein